MIRLQFMMWHDAIKGNFRQLEIVFINVIKQGSNDRFLSKDMINEL